MRGAARQFMYFETGQGSELSYGKHNGIDMTTAEALCYTLARRDDPFMINNVTGFIGPETHRNNMEMILSNLQDHFMGKLLGLPMGMAPCYTLPSEMTPKGQQIATELLAAAGANYFMDDYLSVDRMLAYFDTSSHDNQTMRETFEREPAPEFTAWATERGIFDRDEGGRLLRGPNWGNPRIFGASNSQSRECSTSCRWPMVGTTRAPGLSMRSLENAGQSRSGPGSDLRGAIASETGADPDPGDTNASRDKGRASREPGTGIPTRLRISKGFEVGWLGLANRRFRRVERRGGSSQCPSPLACLAKLAVAPWHSGRNDAACP